MKSLFSSPQLPLAAATARVVAVQLPTQITSSVTSPTIPVPAAKRLYKACELVRNVEQRAQFLNQRRTVIRTSAKRW